MTTESTEVAEPFVNPWHPNAIPPIDPRDPRIVHPTGEFGPESYIDLGAYSPSKYPSFKKSSKRSKKKQDENGKKKKRAHKETGSQHNSFQAEEKVMATGTAEVAEPFVNPWHPNAIPPIDPRDPRIVHPTGEFGPDSYIDLVAYSPAKYPSFKESSKRSKKKRDENGKKKKRTLKLDFSKIKKGMTQTIFD